MKTEKQSTGTANPTKSRGAGPPAHTRDFWRAAACLLTWLGLVVCSSGQTIYWQEDWESPSAQDNWVADYGYWEIGVPTYGPPDRGDGWLAHQGTNVAATVLNGPYTDDRQSRLASSPISVPAAGLNPRLRFWHWWSFGSYDYGQVQISTNNGTSWINLPGQYSGDSSGRWSRAWLDLTPYAGKTVRLGLYFHSYSPSTGSGWYVDEMVIETGSPTWPPLVLPEGFETGWGGWSADYFGGQATDWAIWEIGVPTSGPGAAHSGTNCAATVLTGSYPDSRSSRLVSQPFVVPPANLNPRLRFWHWWSFGSYDYGQVQISTNNGTSWIALATYNTSSPWTRPQLDLTRYAGKTARLGLLFHSDSPSTGSGWYVDEIRILHDPALFLVGSPVVRTQDTTCVSLAVAVDSPSSGASFVIEAPAGNLDNPNLSMVGCWTGSITPQSATQWLVNLQSSCATGSAGVESIGTICFTAVSPQSAFVPLTVSSLVFSNLAPAHAYGTRVVNIANEPLLYGWVDSNKKRMLTTYGKPNTSYVIHQSTDVTAGRPWPLAWTNTVPASLFTNSPVSGPLSNAPVLFLDGRQQ